MELIQASSGQATGSGAGERIVLVDLSDFVNYIGHHPNPTGIQRVQANFVRSAQAIGDGDTRFICWNEQAGGFDLIDPEVLAAILADLDVPEGHRAMVFDKQAAKRGVLPGAERLHPQADWHGRITVLLLGGGWVIADYFAKVLALKRNHGATLLMTVHDLIPIFAPEMCDEPTTVAFGNFLLASSYVVDQYICVSESTRRDLERYFAQMELGEARASVITSGCGPFDAAKAAAIMAKPVTRREGPFVLFVSTIEGRKNHIAAYRAWEQLVAACENPPRLICVGRQGWRADEFLGLLRSSHGLDGRIEVLSDIPDGQLEWLYANCLFTIYPSLYEGWGLPIAESLARGKLCVASNVSAMPEAGGDLALYVDPDDPSALFETIRGLIDRPEVVEERVVAIRSRFAPRPWDIVVADYLAVADSTVPDQRRNFISIETGREYPIRALPTSGEDRQGPILADTLPARQFCEGLHLRGAGSWMFPEQWGTWLGLGEASQGSLDFWWPGGPTDVVIGLLGAALSTFAGRTVRVSLNGATAGYTARACAKNKDLRIFAMPLTRGVNRLTISLDVTDEDLADALEIDGRGLMWGAVSIVFLDPSDAVSCRALVENPYRLSGTDRPQS